MLITLPDIWAATPVYTLIKKPFKTMTGNIRLSIAERSILFLMFFLFQQNICAQQVGFTLNKASRRLSFIEGKKQNGEYLYTTAGNRLYCIGDQSGHFPEIGFHVPGEMGGIWQQPIKLMDGFGFIIKELNPDLSYKFSCDHFISYPFLTKFQYSEPGKKIAVVQTQFVPDNLPVMVVEYRIQNNSYKHIRLSFEWHADVNLMPVWLAERIGIRDGADQFSSLDSSRNLAFFKDEANDWYAGIGFENSKTRLKEIRPTAYKGKGISGVFRVPCDLPSGATVCLRFYISGSVKSQKEIAENIRFVKTRLADLFALKKSRYEVLRKTSEVSVPDSLVQTAYEWGKYATDWLRRDVPGLGRGLSAGLPDYPWFFSNDQAITFMALTGTMPPQLFYDAFRMLKKVSDKVNDSCGRIVHELSSNGVVYDKGKMQESQLHIIAAWQIFKWTGDLSFLKENYVYAQKTWAWLQEHDANHNGYIEGYGGVEIEGLNDEMLDVQIYTFRFLEVLSRMADIFGDRKSSKQYALEASTLKNKINKEWWVETESCYADFLASREKALNIIDKALAKRVNPERNKWAQVKLDGLKNKIISHEYPYDGYLVYYNAGTLDPVVEGMTDTVRALQMLKRVSFFTNRFGAYIAGIERPDDISLDERSFQKDSVFSYNRAVMPAATTGLIIASARFGLPDTALMYMHKTLNSFSYASPGTIYEVSPDYGMFVQAWNVTNLNIPLIQYFFGVDPDAYKKEITVHLRMPHAWKQATLKNLLIGKTRFSIQYRMENNMVTCTLRSSEPGWKLNFVNPSADGKMIVNNKLVQGNHVVIELGSGKNILQYKLQTDVILP